MAYLDDPNGRPAQQKFLDLLPLKPQLKEEVLSALHKIPELKLRPEKIAEEEYVVKPSSWRNLKDFPYLDPVPCSMLHVDIRELSAVDIDWKMLTLDVPESQLEIQIFSRMVYLEKLMIKCIIEEREKKAKLKYVRLRTKGRAKPPSDSDADKSDEFTYEYFSRFFGVSERAQAMEEIPKPAAEDPKPRPPVSTDNPVNRTPVPQRIRRKKKLPVKRKLRKKKRKKKSRKPKLRKRKKSTKPKPKAGLKTKTSKVPRVKLKKGKTTLPVRKKVVNSRNGVKRKCDSSKTTLVQMLKAKELEDKRRNLKEKRKVDNDTKS